MWYVADRWRTRAGAVLGIALLAGLLGVAACLKVPVGDPERSLVDHRFDGAWLIDEPDDAWFFRPWDTRTWLVTVARLARDASACYHDEPATPDEQPTTAPHNDASATTSPAPPPRAAQDFGDYSSGNAEICNDWVHKAWLTALGGQVFLVLEPAAVVAPAPPVAEDYPFSGFRWLVYRVDWLDADRVRLRGVDEDFHGLDKVSTREEAERIIAANVDNPALYGAHTQPGTAVEADGNAQILRRPPPEVNRNLQSLLWVFSGYSK